MENMKENINLERRNEYDFFFLEKFFYEKFKLKYFGQNRIGRLNFFIYQMFLAFLFLGTSLLLIIISKVINTIFGEEIKWLEIIIIGIIMIIVILVYHVLWIKVSIRRLHDLNINGWHVIWSFFPIFGFFFMLYLLFVPGNPGENKYGPSPK